MNGCANDYISLGDCGACSDTYCVCAGTGRCDRTHEDVRQMKKWKRLNTRLSTK